MTTADQKVDQAAGKLQQLSNRMAGEGGFKAKLAQPFAEDANFIRKLKPSLIKARMKGEAPRNQTPGATVVAPSGPQLGSRPKKKKSGGGPNPWVVVGAALATGIVVAKLIDWRGHAHPRN
jgi:hypothetical protein